MYFSKSSKYLSAQNINEKFYPFCENGKDLCQKIREDMTGGPSIVFTRKAVVDKTLSVIHQISANQSLELMPGSSIPIQCVKTCQHDCTLDGSLIPICKNSRLDITDLEALMSYYQETKPECRIESFHTSGNQKKIDSFNVDGFCDHFKTVFEAMGCYYHFFLARRLVPHLMRKILREEKNERDG